MITSNFSNLRLHTLFKLVATSCALNNCLEFNLPYCNFVCQTLNKLLQDELVRVWYGERADFVWNTGDLRLDLFILLSNIVYLFFKLMCLRVVLRLQGCNFHSLFFKSVFQFIQKFYLVTVAIFQVLKVVTVVFNEGITELHKVLQVKLFAVFSLELNLPILWWLPPNRFRYLRTKVPFDTICLQRNFF